ncbi:vomeronasal type-2 receptor 26-like [Spea bombifrons]|uniref:vomeronasal type-2 receptor 26-like n=1 Tax=Spea bombifrons TaxID=233779 RepID=UPI0023497760|nr:vomeronasal type-2 receptor 26-like [Spea bombifrons]
MSKLKSEVPSLEMYLLMLVLNVMLSKAETQNSTTACNLQIKETFEDYEYFKDGDLIIGGVFTVNSAGFDFPFTENPFKTKIICMQPTARHYVNVRMFLVGIEIINNNPNILPNTTLGYHIHDSCLDTRKAVKSVLQILSGPTKMVPNFSCSERGKLVGFIGDHYSITTVPIAQILSVYGYTQISYGATDYMLANKRLYPSFFRMIQNDHVHYRIICDLLTFFGWTWVGIIISKDDAGEQESLILSNYMKRNGICTAYTLKVNVDSIRFKTLNLEVARKSSAQVIILCGSFSVLVFHLLATQYDMIKDKMFILPSSLASNSYLLDFSREMFHFSLAVPVSQCSKNCLPGFRKVPRSTIHACCYDCVPCAEGEISHKLDSENCLKCSENEWPNMKKDRCIPRVVEFLSYTNDALSLVFASTAALFCIITVLTLILFVVYRGSPIVKANNRNHSFILLVSIMLSFLCVFLFLGRPVDITCMLRQTSFGVIFSVAVSSVLAKTTMVYFAFKSIKPCNVWNKWIRIKLPNCIVLFCSAVQIIISISWLAISPPFQEQDMHSYKGKIIIQCNEGSVIAFYSVLGYLGILAAVSFIIAFLARSLPDSFNEAKYITFSMLVFCSVWIAMIPAYLSTKGKYMVAVEIFAILTSTAGLLGCIFFPKCYIILLTPEKNKRMSVFRKRNIII